MLPRILTGLATLMVLASGYLISGVAGLFLAAGVSLVALALVHTYSGLQLPDWMLGGSPLAGGLFGAGFVAFAVDGLVPTPYGTYVRAAGLLLALTAFVVSLRARYGREQDAADALTTMLASDIEGHAALAHDGKEFE